MSKLSFCFVLHCLYYSCVGPKETYSGKGRPTFSRMDVASCQNQPVDGEYNLRELQLDGNNRSYYVYTPTSEVRAIVLNLHQLGGSCEEFRTESCIVTAADAKGWKVITPCGLPGLFGMDSWNAGTCCQPDDEVDDFLFMTQVLERERNNPEVETYAVGYSNGAMLAEALLCQNTVSKAVTGSGIVALQPGGNEGLQECTGGYSQAGTGKIGHIHGVFDILVPYSGNALLGFPSVPNNMAMWADNMGCTGESRIVHSNGSFDFLEWNDCKFGNVTLVRNNLGGHAWWENSDFSASKFAIEFLSS